MSSESIPLVPFGKYKGQPVTTLLNDTKYLEWCKQQEWFQKFPDIYNYCMKQTSQIRIQNVPSLPSAYANYPIDLLVRRMLHLEARVGRIEAFLLKSNTSKKSDDSDGMIKNDINNKDTRSILDSFIVDNLKKKDAKYNSNHMNE